VLRLALEAADEVVAVPSHRHAFGKRMVDFGQRCAWMARLCQRIDPLRARCEAIEAELCPGAPAVYSIELMEALSVRYGVAPTQMALVIGENNLAQLPRFHRAEELRRRFGLLVLPETLAVHSSAIRARLARGEPLPAAWCLPEVANDLNLYQEVE
jgi:nicotinate-nucleotide adenylyltransferase